MKRLLFALVASLFALAACGQSSSEPTINTAGATVIDVRTPAEYASGHLKGAENIDLESGTFSTNVASLDPAVTYVVYCHSGNRSAQAAAIMEAQGLDVIDAGGIDQASKDTGIEIVTN